MDQRIHAGGQVGRDPTAIYRQPLYYDIAFSFRDVALECSAIEAIARRHGQACQSFLELACGPASHALKMAEWGRSVWALDNSEAMLNHVQREASDRQLQVQTRHANMIDFEPFTGQPIDVAVCLMDSIAHILTNDDFVGHLRSVAAALSDSGLYLIEMAHPANHFRARSTSKTDWKSEREGIRVHFQWGHEGDPFDALTEVDSVSVRMTVNDPAHGGQQLYRQTLQCRRWCKGVIEALVELSGVFKIVGWYGAMDETQVLDNGSKSWRMVPVLQKQKAASKL